MKKVNILFKSVCFVFVLAGLMAQTSAASTCVDLLRDKIQYDFIRQASGSVARELFEKMAKVPDVPLPREFTNNAAFKNVRFKQIRLNGGDLVIRVARVEQDFAGGDIFGAEPLYYAQVLGSYRNKDSVTLSDSEITYSLPPRYDPAWTNERTTSPDFVDLANIFALKRYSNSQDHCGGSACDQSGNVFIHWERWVPNLAVLVAQRITIPFNSRPMQQQHVTNITVNNNAETFWGDVKKLVNWFFTI